MLALNFVMHGALGGGGPRSLRADNLGKTLGGALVRLEIDVPDELAGRPRRGPTSRGRSGSCTTACGPNPAASAARPPRRRSTSSTLIAGREAVPLCERQPAARSRCAWSSVSTPSAIEERSSRRARSTTASTIASSNGSAPSPFDERAVDLDRLDRELLEVHERRVAGAEVVERQLHAEVAQLVEQRACRLGVLEEEPLGDLERQQRRVERRCSRIVRSMLSPRCGSMSSTADRFDAHHEVAPLGVVLVPGHGLAAHLLPHPGSIGRMSPASSATERKSSGRADHVWGAASAAAPRSLASAPSCERRRPAGSAARRSPSSTASRSARSASRRCDDTVAERLVEELGPGAPALLRPVHRGVGVAQERLRGPVVDQRDADARGHDERGARDLERAAHDVEHALGQLVRRLRILDPFADHHELVAPEACDEIVRPESALEPFTELDEQPVTGGVAHAVVQDLEAVDVEEEECGVRSSAARSAADAADPVEQHVAVREAGETVVTRLV